MRLLESLLFGALALPSACGGRADSSDRDPSASGGTSAATGGAASVDEPRACETHDDCRRCVYAKAPASGADCESALGCCGGPVMNIATCSANEAAFRAQCSDRSYEPPQCPCILPGPCDDGTPATIGCRAAQCGFGCDQ